MLYEQKPLCLKCGERFDKDCGAVWCPHATVEVVKNEEQPSEIAKNVQPE